MPVMFRHKKMASEHGYDEDENGDIAAQSDNWCQKKQEEW
jgi:hypothetical protein